MNGVRANLALLVLALLAPGLAGAQEPDTLAEEPVESAEPVESEALVEPEGPVESAAPAMESAEAASGAEPQARAGGTYEPDQRGALEREDAPSHPEAIVHEMSDTGAAYARADDFGFELQLWLGGAFTGLDAAGGDNLVGDIQRGGFGSSLGLAAGVRFGPVIVGPRVGLTIDPSFLLTSFALGGDVLFLDGPITPYVRVAVGASLVTGIARALPEQPASIPGVGTELGAGVRWYPWRGFVAGAEVTGAWHHLWRDAVPACSAQCTGGGLDLTRGGESDALQLRLSIFAGWSF